MSINFSDLSRGLVIELDGQPWEVMDYERHKMQQRAPVTRIKMKNLLSGAVVERTFQQYHTGFTVADVEAMIVELKPAGLVGIEAYYKNYSAEGKSHLFGLAGKYDLIITGGTDYHGLDDTDEVMMGGADVPFEAVESLVALDAQRGIKSGKR